jgi:hypothetical protein
MRRTFGVTFPHRHNEDGSHDSICPICFATVATEPDEAKLRLRELAHHCDPMQVHRVRNEPLPQASLDCRE